MAAVLTKGVILRPDWLIMKKAAIPAEIAIIATFMKWGPDRLTKHTISTNLFVIYSGQPNPLILSQNFGDLFYDLFYIGKIKKKDCGKITALKSPYKDEKILYPFLFLEFPRFCKIVLRNTSKRYRYSVAISPLV